MARTNVQEAGAEVLSLFERGDLPKAASYTLLLTGTYPARSWSWRNRLLVVDQGDHPDARGYRQWQAVGRQVRKGETAIRIFAPRLTTVANDTTAPAGEEDHQVAVTGWLRLPVFSYLQTEGEPLPAYAHAERQIAELPLVEVAHAWGLRCEAVHMRKGRLGAYNWQTGTIKLAVSEESVWLHELVHAADDRAGTLKPSTPAEREIVAEFGASLLLYILDSSKHPTVDALRYLEIYAMELKTTPLAACTAFLNRTCAAVSLILDTAEGLREPVAKEGAA